MRNVSFLFFFYFLLISCVDDKIYRKQINNNEIQVDWYYYSYITSSSPNYIMVYKKEKEQLIFEAGFGLQDIEIQGDTIVISHLKFQVKPEIQRDKAFEYIVKYQEVNSHDVYLKYLEDEKQLLNAK